MLIEVSLARKFVRLSRDAKLGAGLEAINQSARTNDLVFYQSYCLSTHFCTLSEDQ